MFSRETSQFDPLEEGKSTKTHWPLGLWSPYQIHIHKLPVRDWQDLWIGFNIPFSPLFFCGCRGVEHVSLLDDGHKGGWFPGQTTIYFRL